MSDDRSSLDASSPPLDPDEIAKLDEQIRDVANQAGQQLDYLADLLAEAKAGRIHCMLGFDTWTAYLADRLKPITKTLSADDRRQLIAMLHEAGMSVRDIAVTADMSKSTVQRQVSQSGTDDDETIGLDDKTYQRRNGGYRGSRNLL